MAKNASVIEINGNRYDAVSGQLMGAVKKMASQVKNPSGGVIDGMVRKPFTKTHAKPAASKTVVSTGRLSYKTPKVRQRLQHSQTLMRAAVKRPAASAKPLSDVKLHKARTASVNPIRASRAKTITKNRHVEHFGKTVTAVAKLRTRNPLSGRPTTKVAAHSSSTASVQLAKPLPSMITSVSHQNLERMLDHALTQADAHKQALHSRTKKGWRRVAFARKWLSISAIGLTVLLIGGFFAWQNIPQVSMRVAATRAHVSASVPAYTPQNYSFAAPVSTSDNQVTISYKEASDPQSRFAITQQASNWDSSSVAANAVPVGSQVQTSQFNGTTVYIYGDSDNAKWVNHGVLFTLQDKANLSSDQILKIANGL